MEDIFPQKKDVDYSLLKLTQEGTYSVTKRKDSEQIIQIMKNIFRTLNDKTITDATACVGGDTINFALHFKQVDSIEYNKHNFEALKNNVEVFDLFNVRLHFGDCIDIYRWASDILYIDPPWGGPEYKTLDHVDLFLGYTRLDDWLEEVLSGPYRPMAVFLKVPNNYNNVSLQFLSNVVSVKTYRIRTYSLICILVQ
uniref:Trimethylguanosine synthase n=1 Tax=viral metagenome TaxID=1070528 RepID=A0A6C0CIW6_9ZZZZ